MADRGGRWFRGLVLGGVAIVLVLLMSTIYGGHLGANSNRVTLELP
jgi:hypothetical protein